MNKSHTLLASLAGRLLTKNAVRPPMVQRCFTAPAYTGRYEYETLAVSSPSKHVLHVELNRPDSKNALNKDMFRELLECFNAINDDRHCRVVVISGAGKRFSVGLDYEDVTGLMERVSGQNGDAMSDIARRAKFIRSTLIRFQQSFSSIEKCTKPVIAAVNGNCIGAAVGIVAAADIRYVATNAYFQAKEVDFGMAADMGSLQRLPKITGNESLIREMVYSCRKIGGNEAKELGLVSQVLGDAESTKQAAIEMAQIIASKSPVAVQGSKISLNYARDHGVLDGLRFMAHWNMVMLQTDDVMKAVKSKANNDPDQPDFYNL